MYLAPRGFDTVAFPRLDTSPALLEVYIRAHDAGSTTYLAWQWHDDPVGQTVADHAYVLDEDTWASPGQMLDSALITGSAEQVRDALTGGAFASVAEERKLASVLATTALPQEFWVQLDRAWRVGHPVRVRLTPSQRLAPVPWELLISPVSGERLLRMATVIYEAPYTVHWNRAILPGTRDGEQSAPLYTVDVVADSGDAVAGSLLTAAGRQTLARSLGVDPFRRPRFSRADLSAKLREGPSRWMYVGHVSSKGEVGLAAVHLSDSALGDETTSGEEALPWFGFAQTIGDHRPLTARDLHLGTKAPLAEEAVGRFRLPAAVGTGGAEIWPMPRRVAFVACASGADHASSEVFGLATAALASGAEWVSATRWILPTDHAFHQQAGISTEHLPLVDVVLAVDEAQASDDPVAALRHWQLERLTAWESHGELRDSPILWGSLMTYWMPARPDLRDPQLSDTGAHHG